jgi:hypothetical protein
VIEFGDGEKASGTEATHIYDEPGEYLVKAAGAEELGYFGVVEHTLKVVGEGGEPEEEPEPEPEEKPTPGDGGGSGGGETKVDPPAGPPPPIVSGPSPACLEAKSGRKTAALRLRNAKTKLESSGNPQAQRRLAAKMRKREAALRRARTRVAAAC